jgi:RES domain-containing protein
MRVWRLCKRRYAPSAFTGEGAGLTGGRWNPVDVPVVYTSLSLSLAVLEAFVHMSAAVDPDDYVSVCATLPVSEQGAERVDVARLPQDWRSVDHPALQALGGDWVRSRRSLILLVPSVVIDGEWNAVVNPAHAAAAEIELDEPKPFHFDERMFKVRS